ncbi:MAG: hypothetical protein ACFFD2_21995 [Promethearchaeota archaeon]
MPRQRKKGRKKSKKDEIQQVIDAADRLGVKIDRDQAIKWLADMAAAQAEEDDISIDIYKGFYGHKYSLIDFDAEDLDRIKYIADIVGLSDREGVETAISLSGSAAQGKVQRYPGDLDYFERVNIITPTKEEACKIIGNLMREKSIDTFYSPTYQLIEVKWGTWLSNFDRKGKLVKAGTPIVWYPDEIRQGYIMVNDEKGNPVKIDWAYGEKDPGWCKFDWLINDKTQDKIINVSNMLDVTWEAPDGSLTPLDGYLDPYFQEIYLEARSIPLFSKIKDHLTPDKLDDYLKQLQKEVYYYTSTGKENYGKVAKRLYNIFRLIGAHKEAMFIRELFNTPAACLYQVWALIDTIDDAGKPDSHLNKKAVAKQASELIKTVVKICEGPEELEIVDALMKLRDDITGFTNLPDEEWDQLVSESRFLVVKLVNEYYYSRLKVLPFIVKYIKDIKEKFEK